MAFLRLLNALKINFKKTSPKSENNPLLLEMCNSRKSIKSHFTAILWLRYVLKEILKKQPLIQKTTPTYLKNVKKQKIKTNF